MRDGAARVELHRFAVERVCDPEGNLHAVDLAPIVVANDVWQIAEERIRGNRKRSERLARRLSDRELVRRAANISGRAGCRRAVTDLYEKNVYVAELARRKSNGICQLCELPAPFRDRRGRPFLETHHIEWISEGGQDTIDNTVALCPNCHARMHAPDETGGKMSGTWWADELSGTWSGERVGR